MTVSHHKKTQFSHPDGTMLKFPFNSGKNLPLMLPDSSNIAGLTSSNVNLLCNQPDLLSSLLMSVAIIPTKISVLLRKNFCYGNGS
jgi:hypothetical protein